jgi:beta-N-acetylhexosaminidase
MTDAMQLPAGPVIIDVAGARLTEAERARLRHPLTGGVILFARNFESRRRLVALCDEIRSLRSPALLICVDHEGGRVQRFRKGFTEIPRCAISARCGISMSSGRAPAPPSSGARSAPS